MRKHTTLAKKQIPTGDLNCPEEVELAKSVKCMIGNKTAVGDAEKEFKLMKVEFGENGANPNPELEPMDSPDISGSPDAVGVTERKVTPSSTITKKKRAHRKAAAERQARKDDFIDVCRLNLLPMQKIAEQRDNKEERNREPTRS